MISGEKKYKVSDLPVAATFESSIKEHVILLKSSLSKIVGDNELQRIPNTGLRIEFEDFRLNVFNLEVLDMLLNHQAFNATRFGFTINKTDPTGFWRAQGVVEEQAFITFKPKSVFDVDPEKIDLKKLDGIDHTTMVDLTPANQG